MNEYTGYYDKDGQRYMRVSEVLKVINTGVNFDSIPDYYRERGDYFHQLAKALVEALNSDREKEYFDWLNKLNNDKDSEADNNIISDVINYYNWIKENVEEIISVEQPYYDDKLLVACTPDLVCKIKGEVTIPDIKYSTKIYPTYKYQTAAYCKIVGCERRIILKCKGGIEPVTLPKKELDNDYAIFLCALRIKRDLMKG